MFTTATPGVQLLSIVSSGARPSNAAPYPVDVGTATTGAATSPATTRGECPVHARHHDDHPGRAEHVEPAQQSVQAGDTDVHDQVGGAAEVPGGEQRLPRDGLVGRACGHDEDLATHRVRRVGGPRQQPAGYVMKGVGQLAEDRFGVLRAGPGEQRGGPVAAQRAGDQPDLFGVLPRQYTASG